VPTRVLSSNVVPGSKHKCVFWAGVCTVELPPEEVLVPADNFTITFHHHISGKEQVSLLDPQYLPRSHGETWVGCVGWEPPGHSPPPITPATQSSVPSPCRQTQGLQQVGTEGRGVGPLVAGGLGSGGG